jgi:16S rRNA (guanine(966)-N(2))-methyltransferase RsmD
MKFHITITGGKYKGKKLQSASLSTTRSTKSIIKGSLFDTLQFDIVDQNFIEVFGGSGSMGLEAVSRGAKKAYFIERDSSAYSVLKRNCDAIDAQKTITLQGDSFKIYPDLIKKLKDKNEKAYIYFDPPFDIREGMEDIYDKVISLIENSPKEIVLMIIVEHATATKMPENIGLFKQKKSKKFGKSSLSYYVVE